MLKANDSLIDGLEFTIGGDVYIAPPLTLGGIKAILPRLGGNAAEVLSAVLCVALKRNYPDATQPWLEETMAGMEFKDGRGKLNLLLQMSGMVDGDAPEGEGQAAA